MEENSKIIAGPHSAISRAPDSKVRGPGFDTQSGNIFLFLSAFSRRAVVSYWRKCARSTG